MTFVSAAYLRAVGPSGLVRAVQRLLLHIGFSEAFDVDGSGDKGADIVAERSGERWLFQCKWKKVGTVGPNAISEVLNAKRSYEANHAVVVTNGAFSTTFQKRVKQQEQLNDQVSGWDGAKLQALFNASNTRDFVARPNESLRPYQQAAFSAAQEGLRSARRALVVLATGLGKTAVCAEIVAAHMTANPSHKVLVVAPGPRELATQLERAFWPRISRHTPTHLLIEGHRPDDLSGISFATLPAAHLLTTNGFIPDLIVVDEAHHVSDESVFFREIFDACPDSPRLGATATPWRGDGFDIGDCFGEPVVSVGIAEGIRLGYLADIKYRLFADTINWENVSKMSQHNYSLSQLNRKLFLPQRDEQIRDRMIQEWSFITAPKGIVFCTTTEHVERMADLLSAVPQFGGAVAVHGGQNRRTRERALLDFRSGKVGIITCCEILNEGVDIPDVNIVCFARVTHSRRIFIQQLGRGLRLPSGGFKTHVVVLDFVADLKRVKAVLDLESAIGDATETLYGGAEFDIAFSDIGVESLLREWVLDLAELELDGESVKFEFPAVD